MSGVVLVGTRVGAIEHVRCRNLGGVGFSLMLLGRNLRVGAVAGKERIVSSSRYLKLE